MTSPRSAPTLDKLLGTATREGGRKPVAFVLAGHNGSGKSTLWYQRLVPKLQIPLVNADRLTASILPPADEKTKQMPSWAANLRDDDLRWQALSQEGVRAFVSLVMEKRMPFAFETVFSHWKRRRDGTYESKADEIRKLRRAGYFVVLIFVGLASVDLSVLRVMTRKAQGGHGVPLNKLYERYPRTQRAVGYAAPLAHMTVMFDNSGSPKQAFRLVRAQQGNRVLFDCRDRTYRISPELRRTASLWLERVSGPLNRNRSRKRHKGRTTLAQR